MTRTSVTRHAQVRMQQRAISQVQEQLIRMFGSGGYQKGDTYVAYIPRKKVAELRRAIDKIASVTLIYDGSDRVITAMHQTRRIQSTDLRA